LPIRKGFLTLHVSVLPVVLPVGSIAAFSKPLIDPFGIGKTE
jgi:hypothetical protein